MSNINSVTTVFQNLFSNHGSTLLNLILIVSTVGGQTLLRKLTFACPCAYPLNVLHSIVFMLGPTGALFIVGVMINTTTWRIVHGSCFRVPDTRHSCKTVIINWIELIIQSSIAPVAWLFVVFLDGEYYRCLLSHNYCPMDKSTLCKNTTIMADYQASGTFETASGNGKYCPACICNLQGADASYLDATSQIFAWFILIFYGLATFLVLCCSRICDKYTLVQRQYVDMYKDEEKNKFDLVAKEHASQLAERNARAFFNQHDWTKKDWDWVSGVAEVNNPMFARLRLIAAEKTNTTMYTPLQLWSSQKGYKILKPDVLEVDETGETNGVIVPQHVSKAE